MPDDVTAPTGRIDACAPAVSATAVGHRIRSCPKQILEGALVAEKDHLAVDLTTQLQAVGDLVHLGLADALATHVDLTLAVRTTNSDATFTNAGKHRIAVGVINKISGARAAEIVVLMSSANAAGATTARAANHIAMSVFIVLLSLLLATTVSN